MKNLLLSAKILNSPRNATLFLKRIFNSQLYQVPLQPIMTMIAVVLCYFALLFAISRCTGRKATNQTFYRADRQSPWYMVAIGMVGASISGITFVSVPGMVNSIGMTYLQTCMGFIVIIGCKGT